MIAERVPSGNGRRLGVGAASGSCSSRPRPRRRSRSSERADALAREVPVPAEAVDGREHGGLVVGRDLDREPAVAERDDPDPDRARLVLDERPRRGLGGLHPGRREVVAAMLPETSNARMTVPSRRGTLTTPCGRAIATTMIVTDEHEHGREPAPDPRRTALRGRRTPAAARGAAVARAAAGARARGRARRRSGSQEQEQHRRPDEGHRLRPPPLAQGRDPDDRADQILIGGEGQSTPAARTRSRSVRSRRSAASANRFRKPRSCVST